MKAEEMRVGVQVRYPRTGTAGKVIRIEQLQGGLFAELDTTGLFYRIDQLIPAGTMKGREEKKIEKDLEQVKDERDFLTTGFQDALSHTDQSCEGGG